MWMHPFCLLELGLMRLCALLLSHHLRDSQEAHSMLMSSFSMNPTPLTTQRQKMSGLTVTGNVGHADLSGNCACNYLLPDPEDIWAVPNAMDYFS